MQLVTSQQSTHDIELSLLKVLKSKAVQNIKRVLFRLPLEVVLFWHLSDALMKKSVTFQAVTAFRSYIAL